MMDSKRHDSATYLQPAFLICALVLAVAAAGMSVATKKLGLYLKKEPLPLKKPLEALDEDALGPYEVVAKHAIENEDVLESLGTEDYIQWLLEDPHEAIDSAVRRVLVFITYYAQPDRVPHVPEECYTGSGYQRLAGGAADLQVGPRTINGRYLLFDRTSSEISAALRQFPVVYLFCVNGQYAGSRDDARIALNRNIFSKHSYFCKVELAFSQSRATATKADATAASEKLLTVLLPVLERDHWPDRN